MIAKEKVIAGAAMYIEKEILPRLPEMKALAVAGAAALLARRAPGLLDEIEKNPAVKALGVIENGMVDMEAVYAAYAPKIIKPMEIDVPFLGRMSFDRAEVDRLMEYIREA